MLPRLSPSATLDLRLLALEDPRRETRMLVAAMTGRRILRRDFCLEAQAVRWKPAHEHVSVTEVALTETTIYCLNQPYLGLV